jgi:hypothetical protein
MPITNHNKIKIFFLLSFVFIIFSNNFFNYDDSILYGQTDGMTYLKIAEAAPHFSLEKLPYHKAQRFVLPYLIGLTSNYFNIDAYKLFGALSFCIITLILFLFRKIFDKFKTEINYQIFLFSLIIFNPYIVRYYLSVPLMINDLLFLLSGTLIIFSFIQCNKWLLFLSLGLSAISRLESIFFILALIIGKIIYKKKYQFSLSSVAVSAVIFLSIFLLNSFHANTVGSGGVGALALVDRFGLFILNYSLKQLLFFLFLPTINFLPLFFIFIFFEKNFSTHKKDNLFIFSIIVVFIIATVPLISGPIATGKNIIRLINLSYPFIIYIFYKMFVIKKNPSLIKKTIFIFFMLMWSSHPTYSKINLFSELSKIFSN